jgi:RNA polymerase sigma factor (sigma-70 family)
MYATADPGVSDASHLESLADAELLHRYRFGDDTALHFLLRRHSDGLFRFCCHLTGNREDAEDICQETITRAITRVDSLQSGASFKSWLYSIARNLAMDSFRGRKRLCAMPEDEDGPTMLYEDNLYDRVELSEEHQTVAEALARLAKSHQQVLMMREVQGMSYASIADKLDVSQSAVETLLFRARRRLREEYGKRVAMPAIALTGTLRTLLSRLSLPLTGAAPMATKVVVGSLLLGVTAAVTVPRVIPVALGPHAHHHAGPAFVGGHRAGDHSSLSIPRAPAGARHVHVASSGRSPLLINVTGPVSRHGSIGTAAGAPLHSASRSALAAVASVGRHVAVSAIPRGLWSWFPSGNLPALAGRGAAPAPSSSVAGSSASNQSPLNQTAAGTQAAASSPAVSSPSASNQSSSSTHASGASGSPSAKGGRGSLSESTAAGGAGASPSSGSPSHPQTVTGSNASQDPVGQTAGQVQNAAGQAGSQASNTAGQPINGSGNGSSGSANGPAQSVANQAGNTASQVTNQASNNVNQVGNTAGQVTNQASNTANNTAGQAQKTGGQAAGQAGSTASQTTSQAQNTANQTTNQAQNTTNQTTSQAQNTAGGVTQTAGQTAGQVKKTAGGASNPVPTPTLPSIP